MHSTRAYVTSPIPYTRKTSYIPATMSRTRQPSYRTSSYRDNYTTSYGSSYTPSSYGSTSSYGTGNYGTGSYGSTYNKYSSPSRTSGLSESRYGTTSRTYGTTRTRPLPSGPGPLDENGRRISVTDGVRRISHHLDSKPPRPSYNVSRATTRSPLETSTLRKRTNSVSDLTAGFERLGLSSPTSSLGRSKRFGSQADIAGGSAQDDSSSLYESPRAAVTSQSYYNTNSGSYDYKSSEHESVLPSINPSSKGMVNGVSSQRSPSPEKRSSDSPANSHRASNSSSRQNSTNSITIMNGSRLSPDISGSRGLVGLKNLGNTCFMNCILQSLSNTQLLLDYCLSDEFKEDINRTSSSMKGGLVTAFAKLVKSLWKQGSESALSATDFKAQLQKYASRFVGYNQQDSQEFLIYLLEGLHEDLNRVMTKRKYVIQEEDGEERISASEKAKECWKNYLQRDNSKIVDIFVGQLRSALTCTQCGYVSNTFDPFWDLSLPIKKSFRDPVSLYDCFDLFTQEESLDGDEKPTCARCKQRRRCKKSFSIQRFPKILIIHLKRFDQGSYLRSKLSTTVDFPMTDLDLTKYAAERSGPPAKYNLYAVSNHSGTPYSGHYTAYCRHPHSGKWHYYSDARVSSVSTDRIQSAEAYVLFYELASQSSRL